MVNKEKLQMTEVDLTLLRLTVTFVAGFVVLVTAFVIKAFFGRRKAKKAEPSAQAPEPKRELAKFLTRERQRAPLLDVVALSHDTKRFRFGLPEGTCLGLPCGKHIRIFAPNPNAGGARTWNGAEDKETDDEIERKYTPTSSDVVEGYFDLVVKVYTPNERFSDGGKLSQYLDSLKVGDELEFSGPWGLIEYKGDGKFKKGSKELSFNKISMIAGGSGITPMLQVIEAILTNDSDRTGVSLIFANQTEKDILLHSRLEELSQKHKDRFKVHFTLDRPPQGWTHSTGFVTKEMIETNLWPAGDDVVVLLCGPPPMIKFACKPNLEALGFAMDRVFEF